MQGCFGVVFDILVDKATLTPIYPEGIEAVLESEIENLELMASHLAKILLKNWYAMSKLTYFLRLSPYFLKPRILVSYDTIIKNTQVKNLSIQLPKGAWSQATLPRGLGLRLRW